MCGEQGIQCCRKARIKCHLHEHLNDLVARAAYIQRRLDMNLQLRLGVAERSQSRDRRNLAGAQIELGPTIDVTEAEFDQHAAEVWSDWRERCDYLLADIPVDLP